MKANKLYNCFNSENKVRLLNILREYPMSPKDLSNTTKLSMQYINELLQGFYEAGLIKKLEIKKGRMQIYMSWKHEIEYQVQKLSKLEWEESIEKLRAQNESNRRWFEARKDTFTKEEIKERENYLKRQDDLLEREAISKSYMRKYRKAPEDKKRFIEDVFRIFKFDHPDFKKDLRKVKREIDQGNIRSMVYLKKIDSSNFANTRFDFIALGAEPWDQCIN